MVLSLIGETRSGDENLASIEDDKTAGRRPRVTQVEAAPPKLASGWGSRFCHGEVGNHALDTKSEVEIP